jgi:probable F420-dependent oxidoreductase
MRDRAGRASDAVSRCSAVEEAVRDVLIGAVVPNAGDLPGRLGVAEMARAAEAAGASSLWVSDHLLMVDAETTGYPYSEDAKPTWPSDVEYYECFACCAAMAAVTRSCRVGPAVLVLPQRNVLEVAKIAATLDRLSGGRFALGVGAGWYSAEMEALGYAFDSRGERLDEMIDVLRDCWSGRPRPFSGRHVTVPPDVVLSPRPAQPDGVPILVGGMTDAAIRRAAARGDGWLALAFVGTLDVRALAERHQLVRALRADMHRGGRYVTALKLHAAPDDAGRLPALARELAAIGFDELVIEAPWAHGLDCAAEVIGAVRASVSSVAPSGS